MEILLTSNKEFYDSYNKISVYYTFLISLLIAYTLTLLLSRIISGRQSLHWIIKKAINNSEFTPYYQPIVNSITNEIVGAEVLV
ncbi:EAL domain-containing protein, partial [Vibrio artabrorum]